ncbi:MAG: ABC transporter ATP-binding protein/permease [Defluviitaleaceae bacterium]|nr:ABC transporter ATP-binding protein/permease [Defluviitaleaceae bacterium]MCL2835586.1 ABC transporter ATP-binding protein/permease [Defluviitaleaceae bacterium]
MKDVIEGVDDLLTLKRLMKLMKGNRAYFITAVCATAFASLGRLVRPVIITVTIDSVLDSRPLMDNSVVRWVVNLAVGGEQGLKNHPRILVICGLAVVLATVINSVFMVIRGNYSSKASENMAKKMKDSLYDHLQKLPYDYHVKAKTGDLIQRCTSDVETIRRFLSMQVPEMARAVFLAVFTISIMLTVNVTLTLVSAVFIPVIFVFSYVFFKKCRAAFKLTDEKEGEMSAVLQENLTGVRVVRAFGRQKYEMSKFDKKTTEFRDLNFNHIRLMSWYWSSSDLLSHGAQLAVLITGVYLTYNGVITIGTFILFNSYISMLLWPIRQMGRILSDLGKMQVSIGRIFEILDAPQEKDNEGVTRHPLRGEIVFDKVSFHYEGGKPVLNNLSFTVKPGQSIAILGSTGSGKSTVMHMLLRLYDYQGGAVKINGREITRIEKKWLRERIGLVLQEPFLYSKTISNNLRMAKDTVEDNEITEAAKTAHAHGFIEGFEKGYETMIGERGVTLSGGQKQRVAIARTLIKNSDILIFDDSLSAVDTETDAQIRAALKTRAKDVTTFIISQRITTLMHADRILVIENGALTDSGTHEELVSRPGLYLRIWEIQSLLDEEFGMEISGGAVPEMA